ncbi:hypothetical protein AVEN_90441-1 [Araneus ventricosus]|uniref:Uncharacterized protein n=1 Tax=Araneus ventricosus TaxID=182803 RepID=A0A4Y2MR97_ARAVE|nr:hypothetical protein AVEN_90441-1 [Araneus ventricosus]
MVKTRAMAEMEGKFEQLLALKKEMKQWQEDIQVNILKVISGKVDAISEKNEERLARECDRYGISDRAAASFASVVLQDIGIVEEEETSHVVDRNTNRRQRKKF